MFNVVQSALKISLSLIAAGPPKPKKDKKKHKEEELEEDLLKQDGPGLEAEQVESLLETLCEGTDLAQLELVLPGFKLRVRRSLAGSAAAAPAIALVSPVVPVAAAAPAPAAPAPAAPAPAASSDEEDESHLPVLATRVGLFRRGRYVKGKRVGKGPMVNPGDSVKKGQVVAFVEQLGTYWPIEAPQSGEIAAFLVEEGEPVEYHQAALELAPFFGDHIIGDRINR